MSRKDSISRKVAVVAAVALAAALVPDIGQANPAAPGPGPTKPIAEQNLDADGLIRVHEQGTANTNIVNDNLNVTLQNSLLDVNVTNDSLPVEGDVSVSNFPANQNVSVQNFPSNQNVSVSNFPSTQSVSVSNFPATQNVSMPVVSKAKSMFFATEDGESETQSFPVINATTIIVAKGDDEGFVFLETPLPGDPEFALLQDTDGTQPTMIYNFPYPIPVDGITLACQNESENCITRITVVGF